jgi:hypothetical protein
MRLERFFEIDHDGRAFEVSIGDPSFYDEALETVTVWIREYSIDGGAPVDLVPTQALSDAALELLGRYEDDVQDERRECAAYDRAMAHSHAEAMAEDR